jgi:hypothetical protein
MRKYTQDELFELLDGAEYKGVITEKQEEYENEKNDHLVHVLHSSDHNVPGRGVQKIKPKLQLYNLNHYKVMVKDELFTDNVKILHLPKGGAGDTIRKRKKKKVVRTPKTQ